MFFLLVILGAWMSWVQAVYGKPEGQASNVLRQDDAPLPEPPEMFKRLPVLEPDDTPEKADLYVRFVARSRR